MAGFFDRRYRGFRVVNLVGVSLLVTIVLAVYLGKTFAGRERSEIAEVEMQIRQEKIRIRLLQAEVAHLEQPRRLQSLAAQGLGMKPIMLWRPSCSSCFASSECLDDDWIGTGLPCSTT